jgi:hypothetical protein
MSAERDRDPVPRLADSNRESGNKRRADEGKGADTRVEEGVKGQEGSACTGGSDLVSRFW